MESTVVDGSWYHGCYSQEANGPWIWVTGGNMIARQMTRAIHDSTSRLEKIYITRGHKVSTVQSEMFMLSMSRFLWPGSRKRTPRARKYKHRATETRTEFKIREERETARRSDQNLRARLFDMPICQAMPSDTYLPLRVNYCFLT